MLEVVASPSGAERVAAAGAFVRAFPPATEVLVVGASREAVDDFVRETTAGAGASFGLRRFSFGSADAARREPVPREYRARYPG